MSILNLALYGVALERPRIDQVRYPGFEHMFTSSKTTSDIRAAGVRFPQLVCGLNDALEPLYDLLYDRFEQLQLHGVPFRRGVKVTSYAADTFFDEINPTMDVVPLWDCVGRRQPNSCYKYIILALHYLETLQGYTRKVFW